MTITIDAAPITDARLWREFSYVAGRWTSGESNRTRAVTDPADGMTIGHIAELTAAQATAATAAAEAAFPAASALLPQERRTLLRRWHDAIIAARADFARS